jgi:hypothetical protein
MDGQTREFLASLRRRGGDLDLALFDPAFAAPLLSATRRSGVVHLEIPTGGPSEGEARRLVELLVELYAQPFQETAPGRAEARTGGYVCRLEGVRARLGCVFPEAIELVLRVGREARVRVVTLDVSCPGGTAPDR